MKSLKLATIASLLISSAPALCQSIELMTPLDGDSVSLSGFKISAQVRKIPEFDDISFVIQVLVWDEIDQNWAVNSSAIFNQDAVFSGRNVRVISPDLYRYRDWADLADFHLTAAVGNMAGSYYYYYPAEIGDEIRLEITVQIWKGPVFYLRGSYANLTVVE